jgi:hypothetical protein
LNLWCTLAEDEVKVLELDKPTKELIERYGKQFEQKNSAEEEAIRELYKIFPDNQNYKGVLLKSIVINTLYATQIRRIVIVAKGFAHKGCTCIRTGSGSDRPQRRL